MPGGKRTAGRMGVQGLAWEWEAKADDKPAATWVAEAEVVDVKAPNAMTGAAVAEARSADIEARIAELELAERAETRACLHADAAHVWGERTAAATPPSKVT